MEKNADWEQQPTESGPAFEAFRAYLDKGPDRSIRGVSDELGVSRKVLEGWSRDHDWPLRVRLWTRAQDRAAKRARRDELHKMAEQHRVIGKMLAAKALERLRDLDPVLLKPSDVVSLLRLGTDLQTASFSYATEDLHEVAVVAQQAAETFKIDMPEPTQEAVSFDAMMDDL